jgi:hypothetical protein
VLRDGDIVFRMGDARTLSGYFPFSRFLAGAGGSRFSHAGIVAIEDGSPVVYDCTKEGIRRQPLAVWTLDNFGPFAAKRLKAEHRRAIPGVLAYCRRVFEEQVPFDYSFDLDDSALYCLEITEKAFRSQGLTLSEPVRLGEMENATEYPICMMLFVWISPLVLKKPLTLEQAVYMPGNGRHGLWGSALLESVYPPPGDPATEDIPRREFRLSLRGDLAIVACVVDEFVRGARSQSRRDGLAAHLDPDSRGRRSGGSRAPAGSAWQTSTPRGGAGRRSGGRATSALPRNRASDRGHREPPPGFATLPSPGLKKSIVFQNN